LGSSFSEEAGGAGTPRSVRASINRSTSLRWPSIFSIPFSISRGRLLGVPWAWFVWLASCRRSFLAKAEVDVIEIHNNGVIEMILKAIFTIKMLDIFQKIYLYEV
jgi:hypothetical protein